MAHKVLLAAVTAGGGHKALRDSMVRSILARDPSGRRWQPVPFDSKNTGIEWVYHTTMRYAPPLQRFWWGMSDLNIFAPLTKYGQPDLYREAVRILSSRERPDAIVATHLAQAVAFAAARHDLGLHTPLLSAIPDYGLPTLGFFPTQRHLQADILLLQSDDVARHYRTVRRVPEHRLALGGLLVAPAFQELGARRPASGRFDLATRRDMVERLRTRYPDLARWKPERPTLLVMGGSAWAVMTAPLLERIARTPSLRDRLNVIVVCGRNPTFIQRARRDFGPLENFVLFDFVPADVMATLMAVADVPVLGSIAPASMHELLEMRCGPLMVFHTIVGAEDAHGPFIENEMLGIHEPDPDRMLGRLLEVTGILPASQRIESLRAGFASRARALREQHRQRAAGMIDLLDRAAGTVGIDTSEPAQLHHARA